MTSPRSSASDALLRSLALKPSDDGRNVVRADSGEPFFWYGDTTWELFHRLDKTEAQTYLENRAAKGFNVAMIVVVAEHGGLDYPSRDGFYPFLPAATSSGKKYVPDVTKINPAYFDFVDWVVDKAASLGIVIALVPTWGRYFNYGYYPDGPILFDEDNIRVLGGYIGERYPYCPFIVGGDSNRYWSQNTITVLRAAVRGLGTKDAVKALPVSDSGAITEALAASLVSASTPRLSSLGCQPFITYHPASCWLWGTAPATSSDFFPESDWLSMDVIQSGHSDGRGNQGDPNLMPSWKATYSYQPIRQMYEYRDKNGRPRPVHDLENHYESTPHGFVKDAPLWEAKDIRNGAFQAFFAGACGITYGVNSIWQMHNPTSKTHPPIAPPTNADNPWYEELDLPGAFHLSYLKNFITSLPSFASRVPDQTFILSPTHEGEGDSLISGLRSTDDRWALVYSPKGEIIEVEPKVLGEKGLKKAEWYDPRTGERSEAREVGGGEKSWKFSPPTSGTINEDWCLVLLAE